VRIARNVETGGKKVTNNLKGLLNALRQSINEAILESDNVSAAMAALKRTGKCSVFTIDVALEEAPQSASEAAENTDLASGLVWSDSDLAFLHAIGIYDEDVPYAEPILASVGTDSKAA
jgi:hypothetical protein